MREFQVGDIVKCIDIARVDGCGDVKFLTLGKDYLVYYIKGEYLWIVDDLGTQVKYLKTRFTRSGIEFCTFDLDKENL